MSKEWDQYQDKKEIKTYIVNWTNIYNNKLTNIVKAPNEAYAERAIPRGDVLKSIDKVEEAVWDDNLKKFIPKAKPFSHSKVPVINGPDVNFIEYSSLVVPNQGEIFDFDTAHSIALELLKDKPDTVILHEPDGSWWIGKMDPVVKKSYFQSGKENTKSKKKKDKPINQDDTKARGILYKNYDLYDTGGPGPGAGLYQNMDQYDSVADFRAKKRKEKIRKRRKLLLAMITDQNNVQDQNNLEDPTEITTPIPYNPAEISSVGLLDVIYPGPDMEDKPVTNLYYGRIETHEADDSE